MPPAKTLHLNQSSLPLAATVTTMAAVCTPVLGQSWVALSCLPVVAAVWMRDENRSQNTAQVLASASQIIDDDVHEAERVELLLGSSSQKIRQLQYEMVQIRALIRDAVVALGRSFDGLHADAQTQKSLMDAPVPYWPTAHPAPISVTLMPRSLLSVNWRATPRR